MPIEIATTDEDIAACYPVLRQLRPKLEASTFVADVRRMQQRWLKTEATRHGCNFLTLDSGLKRIGAHRFYRRHGLEEIALHFAIPTDGGSMWTSE
jgi:hypothetical protein